MKIPGFISPLIFLSPKILYFSKLLTMWPHSFEIYSSPRKYIAIALVIKVKIKI